MVPIEASHSSSPEFSAESYPYMVQAMHHIHREAHLRATRPHPPTLTHLPHSLPIPINPSFYPQFLAVFFSDSSANTGFGLLSKFFNVLLLSSAGASLLLAWPWSLTLVEVAPAWASDCFSGSGDWRPALGADMIAVVFGMKLGCIREIEG